MDYKNVENGYEGIRRRVEFMLKEKKGINPGVRKLITEMVVRRCEEFSLSAPELNRDLASLEQTLDTVEFGKMIKGYERAAGLCMSGEKKILLGQDYLGRLRKSENEYGSNWNAFETLTHEIGHAMSKDSQGIDRMNHYNEYTGERMVNLLETINEVASCRTCIENNPSDFERGIRRCSGYADMTFTVGVMAATFGLTEKEFLKLGMNSYANLELVIANSAKTPQMLESFRDMDILTENMHTALYPWRDQQKQTPEQLSYNLAQNTQMLIRISEKTMRDRLMHSETPLQDLSDEMLFNQYKLENNLKFAIDGFSGKIDPAALEATRDVLREEATNTNIMVRALHNVMSKKETMPTSLYIQAISDIRDGSILQNYEFYREKYDLDDINTVKQPPRSFPKSYFDKVTRDDFDYGRAWENEEVLDNTRKVVINNKPIHKIEDGLRKSSRYAVKSITKMANDISGNFKRLALPAGRDLDKTAELPAVDLDKTEELPVIDLDKTEELPAIDLDKTEELPAIDPDKTEEIPIYDPDKTEEIPIYDPDKTEELDVVFDPDKTEELDVVFDPNKTEPLEIVAQPQPKQEPELAFGELPPEQKRMAQEGYLNALRAIQTKEGGIENRTINKDSKNDKER